MTEFYFDGYIPDIPGIIQEYEEALLDCRHAGLGVMLFDSE